MNGPAVVLAFVALGVAIYGLDVLRVRSRKRRDARRYWREMYEAEAMRRAEEWGRRFEAMGRNR